MKALTLVIFSVLIYFAKALQLTPLNEGYIVTLNSTLQMCYEQDPYNYTIKSIEEVDALFALKQKITLGPSKRCGFLALGDTQLQYDNPYIWKVGSIALSRENLLKKALTA